jgi:hypothetical protein
MPKKKLTKTQIKAKLKRAYNNWYDLVLDKMGHPDSRIGMSKPRMMKILDEMASAMKFVK